jgi:hypothetical protein
MFPLRHGIFLRIWGCLLMGGSLLHAGAGEADEAIPEPLAEEAFASLVNDPPFTRTIGASGSMILTGVAHVGQEVFATLLDTKTQESQVVSRTVNFHGWQLLGLEGNPDLMQTWTARVQIPGGEVVSIRYQKPPPPSPRKSASSKTGSSSSSGGGSLPPLSSSQIAEAKNAAVNYKEGFSSDGYPDKPPAEMVAKLSRLSTSQREEINRTMLGHRNQGLGLDERRKIYEGLVERALRGR